MKRPTATGNQNPMREAISAYIRELNQKYKNGGTSEHSFRPALQTLLEACTRLEAINEPRRVECGAPDLVLRSKNLPIAYVETKYLNDGDLDGHKKNREQFDRYKTSLETVLFSDYLDFHLYNGEDLVWQATLATIQNGNIVLNEEEIDRFISLMERLRAAKPQRITSARKLAKSMAYEARLMAKAIEKSLNENTDKTSKLRFQYTSFKNVLLADLSEKRFADLYAQTITFGLFSARINDVSPDDFSRKEAADSVPETNPFLRQIFQYVAGYDIEKSIEWIVDDLVSVFAAVDVVKLRKNFEKEFQQRDPMIHFYEDFLHQYDPATKKKYGVYYTPSSVVNFIVRAVDDILQKELGLKDGLADTSKLSDGRHRVQVLDPATGTGTFLAEVVNRIKVKQQKGLWPKYVDEHLLPRLYGFELMVAPYTIAHIKLDMLINWWGEETLSASHKDRLKVYLTNSLNRDDSGPKAQFFEAIAKEANEANDIKQKAPVMIVLGNPPYSGESMNKSPWIMKLMEDYKKEPGGVRALQEKNPKWINDDYCKFIRMGQDYVERNKEGILAYICNNGFLDNPTFRGMRWSLLNSFDKIYVINLHGNSKKKETCPDGSKDENVFDIMVGTSINIFVKTGKKKNGELAEVFYSDLFGLREKKYEYLENNSLTSVPFAQLEYKAPYYFLVPKNTEGELEYNKGFKVDEIFKNNNVGIVTARDSFTIAYSESGIRQRTKDFLSISDEEARSKYQLGKDARDWSVSMARHDLLKSSNRIVPMLYRPFDYRYTVYTGNSKGFICMPRRGTMRHLLENNISLVTKKGFPNDTPPVFIGDTISEFRYWSRSGMQGGDYVFPLYLYPENGSFDTERRPNLDETIWRTIENWVNYGQAHKPLTANEQQGLLGFDADPEEPHTLAPKDIFDYIYGVLHSPIYRAKYKEFLKVDFPRIPYPKNADEFEHFRCCGHQLRELHLMHNVPNYRVEYPEQGSDIVEQVKWEETDSSTQLGCVRINEKQYFDNVPLSAWEFYIGGYQPAQKWLKDRKGRELSSDEVKHYEKIISILIETDRLMHEIDATGQKVE